MATKTKKKNLKDAAAGVGGTYVYDKALGKLVKVSDRVPKVASKGRSASPAPAGPCGGGPCGRGACSR